uniref:Aminotransferase class IV n=1 Tax=Paulinella chromatophora TaxID=39717 RepID=B1X4F9_PAUCH|nr:aminotransferase class IV [Paulinella chromatophora]ACB42828.1 aminotransferase class IV [Paulinella chromatophora]
MEAEIKAIAWINGHWRTLKNTHLPLENRSLLLADGIFETLLILNGICQLLEEHVARWHYSAISLGLEPPPSQYELIDVLAEVIKQSGIKTGALRLNWVRAQGGERGINFSKKEQLSVKNRCWIIITPITPCFQPVSAILSIYEQRNQASRVIHHKTPAYNQSIQARYEAQQIGVDEALLTSTGGELACSSCATLLIFNKENWLTPPMSAGCLSGVMRRNSIKLGLAKVQTVMPVQLFGNFDDMEGPAVLLNSLGCRPISRLNGATVVGAFPMEIAISKAREFFMLVLRNYSPL